MTEFNEQIRQALLNARIQAIEEAEAQAQARLVNALSRESADAASQLYLSKLVKATVTAANAKVRAGKSPIYELVRRSPLARIALSSHTHRSAGFGWEIVAFTPGEGLDVYAARSDAGPAPHRNGIFLLDTAEVVYHSVSNYAGLHGQYLMQPAGDRYANVDYIKRDCLVDRRMDLRRIVDGLVEFEIANGLNVVVDQ
jgi:hypothetical protein